MKQEQIKNKIGALDTFTILSIIIDCSLFFSLLTYENVTKSLVYFILFLKVYSTMQVIKYKKRSWNIFSIIFSAYFLNIVGIICFIKYLKYTSKKRLDMNKNKHKEPIKQNINTNLSRFKSKETLKDELNSLDKELNFIAPYTHRLLDNLILKDEVIQCVTEGILTSNSRNRKYKEKCIIVVTDSRLICKEMLTFKLNRSIYPLNTIKSIKINNNNIFVGEVFLNLDGTPYSIDKISQQTIENFALKLKDSDI